MEKREEGVEAFGFGLESGELAHHFALCNELPLLRLFIDKFRREFEELPWAFDEHQVNIGSSIGPSFYQPIYRDAMRPDRSSFLKQMGIRFEVDLSDKEMAVLKHLLMGYSATQIGQILGLSTRTIEHRLERLKEKFVCFGKADLVKQARLLESLGYLR